MHFQSTSIAKPRSSSHPSRLLSNLNLPTPLPVHVLLGFKSIESILLHGAEPSARCHYCTVPILIPALRIIQGTSLRAILLSLYFSPFHFHLILSYMSLVLWQTILFNSNFRNETHLGLMRLFISDLADFRLWIVTQILQKHILPKNHRMMVYSAGTCVGQLVGIGYGV